MSPRSEQELLDQTIQLATLQGWLVHHDRPARTAHGWRTAVQGHAGFPDLVLARSGVVLIRELKGPAGHLASAQIDWASELTGEGWVGRNTYRLAERRTALFDIWRPEDFEPLIVPTLTARIGSPVTETLR